MNGAKLFSVVNKYCYITNAIKVLCYNGLLVNKKRWNVNFHSIPFFHKEFQVNTINVVLIRSIVFVFFSIKTHSLKLSAV